MTASAIEKVQVYIEAITTGFNTAMTAANNKIKQVGVGMQGFGEVMAMPVNQLRDMGANAQQMTTRGGRLARGIRNWTHGMKGFRMEMLGVMFFGMMLQRTFMGLLQPVMEAFGVFDLFRLMLLTLFLPVMEQIFPYLLQIMEWFMNLPEPVKEAIGWIVIIGAVLGTLLMVIGSVALGVGSLIQAFPALAGVFSAIGVAIAAVGAPILVIAAIIIAIAYGIYLAWKENFGNIRDWIQVIWEGINNIFGGAFDIIMGLVEVFTALFEGDLDKLWGGIKRIFEGIVKIIWGAIQAIIGIVVTLGLGIFRLLVGIWNIVVEIGKRLWNWLKSVGESIGKMWDSVITWIIGIWNRLPDSMKKIIKSVANFFIGGANMIINAFNVVWAGVGKIIVGILRIADKAIEVVNKIPGVNIGRYSWNISWSSIPNIPYLASGGIVRRPTLAMIGEQGPEAVVPLGQGGAFGGSVNQTNNFYGFTMQDLKRELDARDRRMVDEIRRLVKQ